MPATTKKVGKIQEQFEDVQSRQKSYTNKRRAPLVFQVRDKVFLKAFSANDVTRFNVKKKTKPWVHRALWNHWKVKTQWLIDWLYQQNSSICIVFFIFRTLETEGVYSDSLFFPWERPQEPFRLYALRNHGQWAFLSIFNSWDKSRIWIVTNPVIEVPTELKGHLW